MLLENLDTTIAFAVVMLLLSLQITVLVQMVVALTNLRGRNLAWGVGRLLEQVDPGLRAHAGEIAKRVLTHRTIRHTNWLVKWCGTKATAIRPEELVRVVTELATDPESDLKGGAKAALLKALGMDADGAARLRAAAAALAATLPDQARQIQDSIDRGVMSVQKLEGTVARWFDCVMDRTSESFALYSRLVTVFLGAALAFCLHVDSLDIFERLASSSEMRARLIQAGEALTKNEERTRDWMATRAVATDALAAAQAELAKSDATKDLASRIGPIKPGMTLRSEGRKWLEGQIPEEAARERALMVYGEQFDALTRKWLDDSADAAKEIKESLEKSGLRLGSRASAPWDYHLDRELIGVILTALFLSLGAPFWFNALKQLSNLRPMLAKKVEGKEGPGQ